MKDKYVIVTSVLWLFIAVMCALLFLNSCNVTRVVTTEAAHYQKGDTTVTIVTKTTESYDASKK